ncbi:MAG: FG-GAP repeat protein [ANME-2 cluster archaeon]|nr:FG-GAP repeat protein [ANME-2 cluster archaeon]
MLDFDTALIGAPDDDDKGYRSGSAYVFTRSGTAWTQQAKLTTSDSVEGSLFGVSVSVDGDTAIISSRSPYPFYTYVFTRTGGTWWLQLKLSASDADWSDFFGYSVSVDGDTALIGAYNDNNHAGSVYIYSLVDDIAPVIIINTPANGSTTNDPELNATFNSEIVAYAWYNVNNTGNSTPVQNTNNLLL